MPKFSFTLTRDATESTTVEIEAPSIKEAQSQALETPPAKGWELDDGNDTRAYLPDPDDFEIQTTPPVQTFRVQKLVDAYVVFTQEVKATDAHAALDLAIDRNVWGESRVSEFDHTDYTVHDDDGNEVIGV